MQNRKRLLRANRKPLDSFDQDLSSSSRQCNLLDSIQNQNLYLKLVGIVLEMQKEAGVSQPMLQEAEDKLLAAKKFQNYPMLNQNKNQQIKKNEPKNNSVAYNEAKKFITTEQKICFLNKMEKQVVEAQAKENVIFALKKFIEQKKKVILEQKNKPEYYTRTKFFLSKTPIKPSLRKIHRPNFYTQTLREIFGRILPYKTRAYETLKNITHLKTLWGHTFFTQSDQQYCPVYNILFDNTSQYIISAGEDGKIKIWSKQNGGLVSSLQGHKDYINKVGVSKDNRVLYSAGQDGVRFFDMRNMTSLGGYKIQSIMDIEEVVYQGQSWMIFANHKKLYVLPMSTILSKSTRKIQPYDFKVYHFGQKLSTQLTNNSLNTNTTITVTDEGIVLLGFVSGDIIVFNFKNLGNSSSADAVEVYENKAQEDEGLQNQGSGQQSMRQQIKIKNVEFVLPIISVLRAHQGDILQIKWNPIYSCFSTGAKKDGVCKIWQYKPSLKPTCVKQLKIPKYKMKRKKNKYNCNFSIWNKSYTHLTCSFQQQDQQQQNQYRGDGQVIVYSTYTGEITWQMSKIIDLSSIRAMDRHPVYENIMVVCDSYGKIIIIDIYQNYIVNIFEERAFHLSHPSFCLVPSDCRFSCDGMHLLVATQYGNVSIYGYDVKDFFKIYPTEQIFQTDYEQFQIDPQTYKPILSLQSSTIDINSLTRGQIENMKHIKYIHLPKISSKAIQKSLQPIQPSPITHINKPYLSQQDLIKISACVDDYDRNMEIFRQNIQEIEVKRMTMLYEENELYQAKIKEIFVEKVQKIKEVDQNYNNVNLWSNDRTGTGTLNSNSYYQQFSIGPDNQNYQSNSMRPGQNSNSNIRRRGRRSRNSNAPTSNLNPNANINNNNTRNRAVRISYRQPLQISEQLDNQQLQHSSINAAQNGEELGRGYSQEQEYKIQGEDEQDQDMHLDDDEDEQDDQQQFDEDNQSEDVYTNNRSRRRRTNNNNNNRHRTNNNNNNNSTNTRANRRRLSRSNNNNNNINNNNNSQARSMRPIRSRPASIALQQMQNQYEEHYSRLRKRPFNQQNDRQHQDSNDHNNNNNTYNMKQNKNDNISQQQQQQQQARRQIRKTANRTLLQLNNANNNSVKNYDGNGEYCQLCNFKQATVTCTSCGNRNYCQNCKNSRGKYQILNPNFSNISKYQCFQCIYNNNTSKQQPPSPSLQTHLSQPSNQYIAFHRLPTSPMIPQIGDELIYFFQGYEQFLYNNIETLNNKYRYMSKYKDRDQIIVVPHQEYPELINVIKCVVVDVEYGFAVGGGPSGGGEGQLSYRSYGGSRNRDRDRERDRRGLRQASNTSNPCSTSSSNIPNSSTNPKPTATQIQMFLTLKTANNTQFNIYFIPGYQFIIKYQIYDDIIKMDRFGKFNLYDMVKIKDEEYQIEEIRPLNPEFNKSIWKNIVVHKTDNKYLRRNNNKQKHDTNMLTVNIWEIDNFIDDRAFAYKTTMPITVRDHYRTQILKIQSNQPDSWEIFSEPVSSIEYPLYSTFVEVSMCLLLILKRLDNNYYACERSFVKDVRMLMENSVKFNGKVHQITKLAEKLVRQILGDQQFNKKNNNNDMFEMLGDNSTEKKMKNNKKKLVNSQQNSGSNNNNNNRDKQKDSDELLLTQKNSARRREKQKQRQIKTSKFDEDEPMIRRTRKIQKYINQSSQNQQKLESQKQESQQNYHQDLNHNNSSDEIIGKRLTRNRNRILSNVSVNDQRKEGGGGVNGRVTRSRAKN